MSSTRLGHRAFPLAVATLLACVAAVVTWALTLGPAPIAPPPPLPISVEPPIVADPSVLRAAFFDAEVEPLIAETDSANREAAERCVARMGQMIDRYRDGIDPFVDDLTSISTRFGIIRRMPGDWWKEDDRIKKYVRKKFERHLFSEHKLTGDVAEVLNDFRDEIDANQKRMLAEVQASLDTADLPEVEIGQYDRFFNYL